MILRHAILLKTPMGQQILTPNTVLDEQLDAVLANLKAQLQAQGIDPKQLVILTDVELEESEYEVIEV
jgi:FKBP-type peptidyl-prolyl cis-trans isomerase (trigger factor)